MSDRVDVVAARCEDWSALNGGDPFPLTRQPFFEIQRNQSSLHHSAHNLPGAFRWVRFAANKCSLRERWRRKSEHPMNALPSDVILGSMNRKRIDPSKLKPGPIRHEHLSLSLMARINYLRSTLQEVFPQSMDEWLDAFRRDANPEAEVKWWERLARCYRGYSDKRELSAEQKKALFSVVFKLGNELHIKEFSGDLLKLPEGALDEILALAGERIQ